MLCNLRIVFCLINSYLFPPSHFPSLSFFRLRLCLPLAFPPPPPPPPPHPPPPPPPIIAHAKQAIKSLTPGCVWKPRDYRTELKKSQDFQEQSSVPNYSGLTGKLLIHRENWRKRIIWIYVSLWVSKHSTLPTASNKVSKTRPHS